MTKAWHVPKPKPSEGDLCDLCGELLGDRYEIDHIIPVSRGGSGDLSNLRWVHPTCNKRKGNKTYTPHHVWICPSCGYEQYTDLNVTGMAHPCPKRRGSPVAMVMRY